LPGTATLIAQWHGTGVNFYLAHAFPIEYRACADSVEPTRKLKIETYAEETAHEE